MLFSSWLRNSKRSAQTARRRTRSTSGQRSGFPPRLEALEDRCLLSVLTVTNLQDGGAGSLRAQIAAAQSGDSIVFSSTLFTATTTLSAPLLSSSVKGNGNASGKGHGKPTPPPPPPPPAPPTINLTSGELLLARDLTIQGPGASKLYIIGGRAFEVDPAATVTLSGLTISGSSGGWASYQYSGSWAGYGGGILNHGTLTVNSCTVGGAISGYDTEGGAIFNDGTLFVSDSTISGGRAVGTSTRGGGISNWGTATLINTVITGNIADPDSTTSYPWFNEGGGIYNRGALTLNGSAVFGNNARAVGGGIFNAYGGTLILNGSKIYNNGANYGGGVYNEGTMSVQNASSIDEVDNLGVLNLDNTSTIGTVDAVVGFLSPV